MSYQLIPINFNAYELPTFKESKKGKWYEYGTNKPYKNTYPDYLTYLFDKSSKHAQIINSKVKFIVGQGFAVEGNLTFSERAMIEGFLRMPNEYDTMDELLNKLAKDKKIYGGFCMGVRLGSNGKIAAVDHIDFADIRVGIEEDEYYYTDDWKSRNPEDNEDFTIFKAFPFNDDANVNQDYIIYYKEYRPDLGIYPLPDYVSVINYLESDISISTFTLNNIKNNLSAGYIISFRNGEPTDEEMRNIERRFKDYATGEGRAGQPLLAFGDADATGPEILPIPTNGQDDRFIQLNQQIREEIFTAHGIVNPTLMGIRQPNGLSNNADEIAVASQLYQNLHIDPEQKVFNELFNELLNYNGMPKALRIVKIEPVERGLSEAAMINVMTTDEIREKIGLPPLEAGQSVQMSSDEDEYIFTQLKDLGYRDTELDVISSHINEITCLQDAKDFENEILQNYNFAIDKVLTANEKLILDVLKDNPKLPVTEISKALNMPEAKVHETIQSLQNAGALDKNFIPTPEAEETIQTPKDEVFIVYKYVKRQGVPRAKTGSRPFCKKMLALNRFYTLLQLETLTNDFGQSGIDIFTKRGGWYHNPNTGETTPYCRHIWEQKIVRKKAK